ncbi:bile acid:sodium symporter [Thioalkalivibrio sp.]|uniref:bile acid:sodium symporter family protein n=1 Tax=Thioalkalivibrio sp. TaxID=2093813 RepID=UPI0012D530A8|nr:bile acid:sodium symporter [Thioalkalivibrio sp.]TVP81149.1 MAG: hypothetical protein EA346_06075 [Thioalkalivibrio sp.]
MNLVTFVPVIVVLLMIIVGTEISRAQLVASMRMPRALVGAALAQWLLLPLLAVIVIWLLRPPPALAGGLLLLATSPNGSLSNYYCSVARLNVAFSVTLTTISGFVALAAMPLLLAVTMPVALGVEAYRVPLGELTLRLVLSLLLPVAAGMGLRHFFPDAVERNGKAIRAFGLWLLALFLVLVFFDQRHAIVEIFAETVLLTVTFTALALAAGWYSGRVLRLNPADRAVLAIEFAVRNVGIAALLALTTFQQPEFAAFGALFVLLQAPVLILALLLNARLREQPPTGTRAD